jgi:hypothetical protein
MNNLYRKVAVAFVGITLGFALGANKEAKAAIITLPSATAFSAVDTNNDGLGDSYSLATTLRVDHLYLLGGNRGPEFKALYEFNIASLFLTSNTIITQAIFQTTLSRILLLRGGVFAVGLQGYTGNGEPAASDFEARRRNLGIYFPTESSSTSQIFRWDVTSFINELVSSKDVFAGIGLSPSTSWGAADFGNDGSLVIFTTEPVPEPTTILSAAIALGWGGWLKRKNSQQNKTTPPH